MKRMSLSCNVSGMCLCICILMVVQPVLAAGELRMTGRTYIQSQTLEWLDAEHFAVGRWDGTVSVYYVPFNSTESGPQIVQTMTTPSRRGIEMLAMLPTGDLAISNNESSMALWRWDEDQYRFAGTVLYDPLAGMFNSGCNVTAGPDEWYVSGHANGSIIRWKIDGSQMIPQAEIDIRSLDPIQSPYQIKNVRGIVHWRDGIVITGDEDGDLCMIDILSGRILHRIRYNMDAQRGINGLAICGDQLLVTNCVVGTKEHNFWLFHLDRDGFTPVVSRYVCTSPVLPDIFSMDAVLMNDEDNLTHFYISTGEGLIWHGTIEEDSIQVLDKVSTGFLGVAPVFDWNEHSSILAAADYDIRIFDPVE